MQTRLLLLGLSLPFLGGACRGNDPDDVGGEVTISIQQALTGETTSAGTFRMAGSFSDEGTTTEELTFGGPLTQPNVPVTFRRTLVGKSGTIVLEGPATLSFTSATAATIAGNWSVKSATGRYAGFLGSGRLTGTADFAAAPPSAKLTYTGAIDR
jgi:hypothetical protein